MASILITKEGFLSFDSSNKFEFSSEIGKQGIILQFDQISGFETISVQSDENGKLYKEVKLTFRYAPEEQQLEDYRPWPFNGYVINNSSSSVDVWSDGNGLYTIVANSTSGRFTEDVDHIKDRSTLR